MSADREVGMSAGNLWPRQQVPPSNPRFDVVPSGTSYHDRTILQALNDRLTMISPHHVPRRTVLTWLAGAGAIGTLQLVAGPGAIAAPSGSAEVKSTGPETIQTSFFSEDFTTEFKLEVPAFVELAVDAPVTGATVTVTYDPRLFTPDPFAVMLVESPPTLRPVDLANTANGKVTFTFADALLPGHGPVAIHLPLRAVDLYPNENLGQVSPVAVTVTDDGGGTLASITTDPGAGAQVAAWSAEMSAAWGQTEVHQGRATNLLYRYPTLLHVVSHGPAPVPAGATLTVDSDRRIVRHVKVVDATLDGTTLAPAYLNNRAGDALRTVVTVPVAIPAGSVLEVALEVQSSQGARINEGLAFASARFAGLDDATNRQRWTRKYEVTDLTPSGTPLVENAATGTI